MICTHKRCDAQARRYLVVHVGQVEVVTGIAACEEHEDLTDHRFEVPTNGEREWVEL